MLPPQRSPTQVLPALAALIETLSVLFAPTRLSSELGCLAWVWAETTSPATPMAPALTWCPTLSLLFAYCRGAPLSSGDTTARDCTLCTGGGSGGGGWFVLLFSRASTGRIGPLVVGIMRCASAYARAGRNAPNFCTHAAGPISRCCHTHAHGHQKVAYSVVASAWGAVAACDSHSVRGGGPWTSWDCIAASTVRSRVPPLTDCASLAPASCATPFGNFCYDMRWGDFEASAPTEHRAFAREKHATSEGRPSTCDVAFVDHSFCLWWC